MKVKHLFLSTLLVTSVIASDSKPIYAQIADAINSTFGDYSSWVCENHVTSITLNSENHITFGTKNGNYYKVSARISDNAMTFLTYSRAHKVNICHDGNNKDKMVTSLSTSDGAPQGTEYIGE